MSPHKFSVDTKMLLNMFISATVRCAAALFGYYISLVKLPLTALLIIYANNKKKMLFATKMVQKSWVKFSVFYNTQNVGRRGKKIIFLLCKYLLI